MSSEMPNSKENCFDINSGTVDSIPFSIPNNCLSDKFPVNVQIESCPSIKPVINIDTISKSTFSKELFDTNLENLEHSFSNPTIPNFSSYKYPLFNAALIASLKGKRQKRSIGTL